MRVSVVVLGDLERSPRMVHHARALAARGVNVDLIGYADAGAALVTESRIHTHPLPPPPVTRAAHAWTVAAGLRRSASQAFGLLRVLLRVPRPDVILVQTPPAVPTLWVARLAARLRSARLVIDWHNLTYTVLALRVGSRHPLVRLMQRHERNAGRRRDGHLTVSRCLADALARDWNIRAQVVRDRAGPPAVEHPPLDRQTVVARYFAGCVTGTEPSAFIVVPTSWSLDDDFDLLLDALDRCDARMARESAVASGAQWPVVLVLLTGRGPQQVTYMPRVLARRGRHVHVRAHWLAAEDYPRVLASADLGISIHRSSSGLDLPMKICDLFAAGVPVCALDYGPCLSELVQHDRNGLLFDSAETLADQIVGLTRHLPERGTQLTRLTRGACASGAPVPLHEWMQDAWPTLSGEGR
jgi:beta-1,4-mannosyltransferase